MARFVLPVIHDNKNGWGPSHIPEQFKDTPYQPFSKGDRLGKVSVVLYAYGLTWPDRQLTFKAKYRSVHMKLL